MAEKPKRLQPTNDVVRELYLKSGNQCAFHGCDHLMMDTAGVFIGQICHIEAAMPGGERFNRKQTNEERRSFSNLLLLCHAHHKVTDDVDEYPVERIQLIKAEHEKKFTDIVSKIQKSFVDYTSLRGESLPKSLNRMNTTLCWSANKKELAENLKEIIPFIKEIKKIPLSTRKLLLIMLSRSQETYGLNPLEVSVPEIVEACQIEIRELKNQFSILEKYGLVDIGSVNDYGVEHIAFVDLKSGWPIWQDLKTFSDKTNNSLSEFIENLRFDLLD
jgi:acyl-CoA-binding protein